MTLTVMENPEEPLDTNGITVSAQVNSYGMLNTEEMNTMKTFDYSELDPFDQLLAQGCATEVKDFVRRSTRDAHRIGLQLLKVKERLGHGRFLAWLEAELGASADTAERLMKVATKLPQIPQRAEIGLTALYLLAANGAGDAAREEAVERAGRGEAITAAKAREIVARHQGGETPLDSAKPSSASYDATIHVTTNHAVANFVTANHATTNHATTNDATTNHTTTNHTTNDATTNDATTNDATTNHAAKSAPAKRNARPAVVPSTGPEDQFSFGVDPVAEDNTGAGEPEHPRRRFADEARTLVATLFDPALADDAAVEAAAWSLSRAWPRKHKREVADHVEWAAGVLHRLAGRLRRPDRAGAR